jgi:hypothetical protein
MCALTNTRATDDNRLGSGTRLKVKDTRNLPKPVKVDIRTKDKVAKSPEELLKWIMDLKPGLNTEHQRMVD